MTDPHPILDGAPGSSESPSQLVASLAIVSALTVIAIATLVIGYMSHQLPAAIAIVSTVVGGLLTALNAPSGLGKLLTAAKAPTPNPTQQGT